MFLRPHVHILALNIDLTHKSYKMVDTKSKTSLIRHIQKNYISPMEINNIILLLRTHYIFFICDIFFLF